MGNQIQNSIEIILRNQDPSGAYIASPNFPSYRFCWLRDGSFIAYAMDLVGEHVSARAFFRWVDRAIRRYTWKVDHILEKMERGEPLLDGDFLHTRYTLAGEEARDQWWNFQLDGYGTWLWALSEHIDRTNDLDLLDEVAGSIQITVRYLAALWRQPNYDCWEEHPQYLHPYTLAAIYAGLDAAQKMVSWSNSNLLANANQDLPKTIRRFTLEHAIQDGHLVKSFHLPGEKGAKNDQTMSRVDASLLGAAIPYRLLEPSDPIFQGTLARLESDLHRSDGGVYRYQADTYYGGGEWLLLTAWLGWYYAESGDIAQAKELLSWVEAQADQAGHMPEQVSSHLLSPTHYKEWENRWGPIAKPLLWSHAMHLILHQAIQSRS